METAEAPGILTALLHYAAVSREQGAAVVVLGPIGPSRAIPAIAGQPAGGHPQIHVAGAHGLHVGDSTRGGLNGYLHTWDLLLHNICPAGAQNIIGAACAGGTERQTVIFCLGGVDGSGIGVTGVPASWLLDLETTKDIHLIPLSDDDLAAVLKDRMVSMPLSASVKIYIMLL